VLARAVEELELPEQAQVDQVETRRLEARC
jgi:hypothetical protein